MASAYTPGLRVTAEAQIVRERRLPLQGEVLVSEGDRVAADSIVARTALPGRVFALNAAGKLNIVESDLPSMMQVTQGAKVTEGDVLAETPGILGLFRSRLVAPVDGTVESISAATGRVMVQASPLPVEVQAYVDGEVVEVWPSEGCVVRTQGALCQGIFGVGGETRGRILVVAGRGEVVTERHFGSESMQGAVAVGGALLTFEGFQAARQAGVRAIVAGALDYQDIARVVGRQVGVAVTGGERLGITLVLTEGFGRIEMARRTFKLLESLEGDVAAVNGATQIRAGVVRPEIIVPSRSSSVELQTTHHSRLDVGSRVRVIRTPNFGKLGHVTELPVQSRRMPSESSVRVCVVQLDSGDSVTVPRANVELFGE
ncbi:MAG: hypothetical protein AAF355_04815 [Myxococcota bacterium]